MQCAEDLVKTSVQHVLDTVHDDLEFFDLRVEKGLLARLEKCRTASCASSGSARASKSVL